MFGIPIWTVYLAAAIGALLSGEARLIRGALALLANWCVLTAAASLTGDQYNVPLNASVDWATVWIGFAPVTQISQVLMALSFGIGMLFHADHLLKLGIGIPLEKLKAPYWWRFHYLAWSQAALMLGWACHGGGLSFLRAISRRRSISSVFAVRDLAPVQMDGR